MAHVTPVEAEEGVGILSKIPGILWERRWLIIIPTVLLGIAGTVAAFVIPTVYESRALLLVESNDVGDTKTGNQDESEIDRRMAKIRQQILSRPDLVDMIQANNLYNVTSRSAPLSTLVEQMRNATNIQAVDADIGSNNNKRRGASSIAFELSFRYSRPGPAQLVAQTFVDRLLRLDATEVRDKAATEVRYLQDQQTKLQQDLTGVEGQIQRVAGGNGLALSSGTANTINIGGNYETQIAQLQRENAQLRAAMGEGAVERDPNVVAAQAALAAARGQYADGHPDVRLAEIRLAAARANASAQTSRNTLAQQQIAANNTQIADLTRARNNEVGRASAALSAAARGPLVAQQLEQLRAQADQVRANLGRVSSALLNAESQSKIADEQRGERLSLIEPPVQADRPSWPNRPLLILGGVAGGIALGLALVLLLEAFLRPIRTVGALTRIVGEPPLAVVPVLSKRRFKPRWKLFGRSGGAYAG